MSIQFLIEPAFAYPNELQGLFEEYTNMLVEGEPSFQGYLDKQNYGAELEHPEMKYGEPEGRLYIAFCDGKPAGCIGLRRLDEENCEIKRLYVRPAYRCHGLGRTLVEGIISDAMDIGYRHILLDTLPFLREAIAMYKSMGFYEIESYNNSPLDGLVYLRLDL